MGKEKSMSEVFRRYRALRRFAEGDLSRLEEDRELLYKKGPSYEYDEIDVILTEELPEHRVEVSDEEGIRQYLVKSWMSGGRIDVSEAYRVLEEQDGAVKVGMVYDGREIEEIIRGILAKIDSVLGKRR